MLVFAIIALFGCFGGVLGSAIGMNIEITPSAGAGARGVFDERVRASWRLLQAVMNNNLGEVNELIHDKSADVNMKIKIPDVFG